MTHISSVLGRPICRQGERDLATPFGTSHLVPPGAQPSPHAGATRSALALGDWCQTAQPDGARGEPGDEPLLDVLRNVFGHGDFRPGQLEAAAAFFRGADVLAVLPTGAGKSLCYQVPALALARAGRGPTVVVSPLIALMNDQVNHLLARGVVAVALHSGVPWDAQKRALDTLSDHALVYVSPERLATARFRERLLRARPARAVIDEAHCISEWGHDFRPEYRALSWLKTTLQVPVLAATATATEQVRADVVRSLALSCVTRVVHSAFRPNLGFHVHMAEKRRSRTAWLVDLLREQGFADKSPQGRALVYTTTRKRAQTVQRALRQSGIKADYYHAGRRETARERAHSRFELGKAPVLVATSAYGMGIDVADVSLVVHVEAPSSLEAYVQQAGRAGRSGKPAECWLGFSFGDAHTHERLHGETHTPERAAAFELVARYATSQRCRQRLIAEHFADPTPPACGICDVCRDPREVAQQLSRARERYEPKGPRKQAPPSAQPLSPQARETVVSFVSELPKPVGRAAVVKALRGSRAREVLKKRLERNPHYGALRGVSELDLFVGLDQLLSSGLLVRKGKKYPTLWLPDKPVRNRKPGASAAPRRPLTLEKTLRNFRKAEARRRRIKAYQVFPDRTLRTLCEARPRTESELMEVWGMGRARVETYGERLLSLLARPTDSAE